MADASVMGLRDDVARAAEVVAHAWPLSSVIATNPLSGFEDLPFDEALGRAEGLFGARGLLTVGEYREAFAAGRIDRDALREATAHRAGTDPIDLLDGSDEPAPRRTELTITERHDRDHGTELWATLELEITEWCAHWASCDPPGDYWPEWRNEHPGRARSLPVVVDEALRVGLDRLGVPDDARGDYLSRLVAALPGWASHLRWRQERDGDDTMIGHLAAMVATEVDLLDGAAWSSEDDAPYRTASVATHRPALVWQEAYERSMHDRLLRSIEEAPVPGDAPASAAQVVCCIDVRSEGLRRNLERVGRYETFGYAGFFGLAAHIVPVSGRGGTDQCPVLLTPPVTITEHGAEGSVRTAAAMDDAWKAAKHHPVAPLALAEASGWAAGPLALLRTAAPGLTARAADHLPQGRRDPGPTTFDRSAVALDDQAAIVAGILRLGIGAAPAPLVVLCGHDARVDNNPMESALACGACGGHGGAPNARIVAAMANDPEVRARLAELGHVVPGTTWFVGALHETAGDRVELLDEHLVPPSHREALDTLAADLDRAGDGAARDRAATLPGRPRTLKALRRRARDWAEPVAELGLAGNMAFVVGPRSLTGHADLGRRVFLHSYDAETDPDGAVLDGILTAPLVVAQWINAQYFFSTTDPEVFGAGSKAVHNVLGDIGVLSGAGGDLRRGLPLQSVRAGSRLLHEPVRLMAVVQGSLDHIDRTIAGSPTLGRLVTNGWIHLVARPSDDADWQRRTDAGWSTHRPIPGSSAWPAAV